MIDHALTPHIVCPDAAAAIDFYKRAFGAEELTRMLEPNGTRVMHCHIRILGSDFMLNDDFSDKMGGRVETPAALGGCPVTFHLNVDDAKAIWEQATRAGAKVTMPLKDQFWGERYGQLLDPQGFKWSIGQKVKDLTREELEAGAKATF